MLDAKGQSQTPPRWLSVDQIRKQQRVRREIVIVAMDSGLLPFEARGRARYARMADIERWEQSRLICDQGPPTARQLHSDLADLVD
jgi:hypothetical protein